MSDVAIRVEDLGKRYRIGEREPYKALRDTITDGVKAPFRAARSIAHRTTRRNRNESKDDTFWALRNVSFEVKRGEVIGIIGRNGAGKSTLLKILSRVTEPTEGHAVINGRVGSLLEVGTGFHPELTGRENIFLNGAILGMSQREIRRKFDEIVDFAGVEKFLETPVKRYSSGMYVRLAFAVAAHLPSEILIVDEVLAVGDAAFQKKCLGKMEGVARDGRTVLFVSHNMTAIEHLCYRAVELDTGSIASIGAVSVTVSKYYANSMPLAHPHHAAFDHSTYFKSAILVDQQCRETSIVRLGGPFDLRIQFEPPRCMKNPTIGIGIDHAISGQRFLSIHSPHTAGCLAGLDGRTLVRCHIKSFPLAPGYYNLRLVLSESSHGLEVVENAVSFAVVDCNALDDGRGFHRGVCIAPSRWSCRRDAVIPVY